MKKEVVTNNFEETQKLGRDFVKKLLESAEKRDGTIVVALEGDLGSGKTTFVQGMAQGLGIKEQITSPTFVLIKKHRIKIQVSGFKFQDFYHIDCYRIDKPWQLQELGFEEIINDPRNIVAIEWAEKASKILPEDRIVIKFERVDENKRRITIA